MSTTPDGLLIIEVPDNDGPAFRILGGRNFYLDPPNHLFFFTRATLTTILNANGFKVDSVSRFSLEYTPYTVLQNLLNLIPGKPNRLYLSFMRNPEGRRLRWSPVTWLHAVAATVLVIPAFTISLFSFIFPIGNILRFYAVKKATP